MRLALRDSGVGSSRGNAPDDAKGIQGRHVSRGAAVVALMVVAALVLGLIAVLAQDGGDGLELVNIDASPHDLAALGDTLYFLADGRLWRSDGTEAGTEAVADVTQGADGWTLEGLTAADGRLYFWARNLVEPADALGPEGEGRAELWTSDGTGMGTQRVEAILPEADRLWVSAIVPAGDTVFMMTHDGHRNTLWRSDGTEGGTRPLMDLSGIGFVGAYGAFVAEFVVMADTAYFRVQTPDLEYALGKSNGTAAGTRVVTTGVLPRALAATTDLVYFIALANDGTGYRLWRSDGTEAGSRPVADVSIPLAADLELAIVGEIVYFLADDDGDDEIELWRSDGTEAGTRRVADLGEIWRLGGFVPVGDALYLLVKRGDDPYELWRSDGTEAGTLRVAEIDLVVREVAAAAHTLFFVGEADQQDDRRTLWTYEISAEES